MVLTVSFVVSPETGCVASVASAMRKHCRQLDTSIGVSGPYDFSVRPGALVSRAKGVHRIPSNVRDDGQRPSFGRDAQGCRTDLPDGLSEIFSTYGLDTQFSDLPVGQISCHLARLLQQMLPQKAGVLAGKIAAGD
jgi:hypothetical protein